MLLSVSATVFLLLPFVSSQNFINSAWIDPQKNTFYLQWANDSSTITFKATARTSGWMGLGFSPNGGMAGADIVIIWIDAQGRGHISDRHGPTRGNGYPEVDQQQNYQLLSSGKNSSWMWATFKRPLQGCDPDDYQLNGGTTRVIWAIGGTVPQNEQAIQQHAARGTQSLQLLDVPSSTGIEQIRRSTRAFDIGVGTVPIPQNLSTVYWCNIVEVPQQSVQYLIAFEMIVQPPEATRHVHHMDVSLCQGDLSEYVGKGSPCFTDQMTTSDKRMEMCSTPIAIWAVGGQPFVYPPNIAFPMFEKGVRYMMIQMHYDNSIHEAGVVDRSYMRMYLQPQPRPILAEKIIIQQNPLPISMIIPPRVSNFTVYAYCPASCLGKLNRPVTAFAGFLHTHLQGRSVMTRIIRRGVEQPPVFSDPHYDFNYQNYIIPTQPFTILPVYQKLFVDMFQGDEIIVECTYDTSNKDTVTLGGLGTPQEMCMSFLDVYPRANRSVEICSGMFSANELLGLFNISTDDIVGDSKAAYAFNFNVTTPRGEQPISEYLNRVNWTPQLIARLQNATKNAPQMIDCEFGDQKLTAEERRMQLPAGGLRVTKPYVAPQPQC